MPDFQNEFEDQLRQDLSALADRAGPGPIPDAAMRHLRRRTFRRRIMTAGTLAAGLLAGPLLVLLSRSVEKSASQLVALWPAPAPPAGPATPQPVSVDASPSEIEAAIRGILASAGISGNVLITKDGAGEISLAFTGDSPTPPDRLRAELEALFARYKSVYVQRCESQIRFTIIAPRTLAALDQNKEHPL